MIANSNLHEDQLLQLVAYDTVLLCPLPETKRMDSGWDILIKKEAVTPLLDKVKQIKDLTTVSYASSFVSSKLILNFKDNTEFIMNLVHKFAHNSLVYLDEENVNRQKVNYQDQFFIPCLEHIFEYYILKNYLASKGIGTAVYQYFKDFHFMIQDGLIEDFNTKFGTSFSSIHQLTDFDQRQKDEMLNFLKQEPENQFLKKVNVQWHNFLGTMRQARIV